jgi:group II intron reverse transcriptase/maturase
MALEFADSPQGSGDEGNGGIPLWKTYLLHKSGDRKHRSLSTSATAHDAQLLAVVASESNLASALLNVLRNRGAPGVDGQSVAEVAEASPKLLPKLCRELLDGSYRPGEVRRVWIPKPGGGQRGLGIPNVMDRWVQQAVLQVLEPIFEPTFHGSSYGFRAGRGAQTAIAQAKAYLDEGYTVLVDIDLAKFFDRVNHQRLLARLGQRVSDEGILKLISYMLKAKVLLPEGTSICTEEGTPQGGPLSPMLSNIVLDELDWELERRGLRFVRYADDANIFVRSQRAGERVMAAMRRFLEKRLRLAVNEEKSSVTTPSKVHFLGFRFDGTEEGKFGAYLSARSEERIKSRVKEMTPRNWGGSLQGCIDALNSYLKGWSAYYRICCEEGAGKMRIIDAHIRRRLRAIVIRQKKRPRFLYLHLLSRKVPPRMAAQTAFQRRGVWHRSNRGGMTRAYPNDWFHERLESLWLRWRMFNPPPLVLSMVQMNLPI